MDKSHQPFKEQRGGGQPAPIGVRVEESLKKLSMGSRYHEKALKSIESKLRNELMKPWELSSLCLEDNRSFGSVLGSALVSTPSANRTMLLDILEALLSDPLCDRRCKEEAVGEIRDKGHVWTEWQERDRIRDIVRGSNANSNAEEQKSMSSLDVVMDDVRVNQRRPSVAKHHHHEPTTLPLPLILGDSERSYLYSLWCFPDVELCQSDSAALTAIEVGVGLRHDMPGLCWELEQLHYSHLFNYPASSFLQRGSLLLSLCGCLGLPDAAVKEAALTALEVLLRRVDDEFQTLYCDPNMVGACQAAQQGQEEGSQVKFRYPKCTPTSSQLRSASFESASPLNGKGKVSLLGFCYLLNVSVLPLCSSFNPKAIKVYLKTFEMMCRGEPSEGFGPQDASRVTSALAKAVAAKVPSHALLKAVLFLDGNLCRVDDYKDTAQLTHYTTSANNLVVVPSEACDLMLDVVTSPGHMSCWGAEERDNCGEPPPLSMFKEIVERLNPSAVSTSLRARSISAASSPLIECLKTQQVAVEAPQEKAKDFLLRKARTIKKLAKPLLSLGIAIPDHLPSACMLWAASCSLLQSDPSSLTASDFSDCCAPLLDAIKFAVPSTLATVSFLLNPAEASAVPDGFKVEGGHVSLATPSPGFRPLEVTEVGLSCMNIGVLSTSFPSSSALLQSILMCGPLFDDASTADIVSSVFSRIQAEPSLASSLAPHFLSTQLAALMYPTDSVKKAAPHVDASLGYAQKVVADVRGLFHISKSVRSSSSEAFNSYNLSEKTVKNWEDGKDGWTGATDKVDGIPDSDCKNLIDLLGEEDVGKTAAKVRRA